MTFFDPIGGKPYLISSPGKRDFYLIGFGALHPQDLPASIQAMQRREADLEAYKITAGIAWQKSEPGRTLEDADQWIEELPKGWLLYLNEADRAAYTKLNGEHEETLGDRSYEIATVMMQNRLALHVEIAVETAKDADTLEVIEPWFLGQRTPKPGDILQTQDGTFRVGLREPMRGNTLLLDERITRVLSKGTPLFLVNDGEYLMGDPNWTIEQSKKKLFSTSAKSTPQINQIMAFYLSERVDVSKTEADSSPPLASGQSASETLPKDPLPTGEKFTGDFNLSDATIAPLQDMPISANNPFPSLEMPSNSMNSLETSESLLSPQLTP